jgi:hypothetical protein
MSIKVKLDNELENVVGKTIIFSIYYFTDYTIV